MFFRITKALILAILMFASLRFLGISMATSLALSLIPAVLGALNIMAGSVYALTGFVFILACGSTLTSEFKIDFHSVAAFIEPFLKKLG